MKMVYVCGGNVNSTLKKWLRELHIVDFVHVKLEYGSIDRAELIKSAENIRSYIKDASALLSVGPTAKSVLKYANADFGALPATAETDKKIIQLHLEECRRYLFRRINDQHTISYWSPSSNEPS